MTTKQKTRGASANGAGPSRVIDLDMVETATSEHEPVTLRLAGENFMLPAEMPAAFALYASAGKLYDAIEALLGEDQCAQFLKLNPSMRHIEALAEQASEVYGVTPGESSASPSS